LGIGIDNTIDRSSASLANEQKPSMAPIKEKPSNTPLGSLRAEPDGWAEPKKDAGIRPLGSDIPLIGGLTKPSDGISHRKRGDLFSNKNQPILSQKLRHQKKVTGRKKVANHQSNRLQEVLKRIKKPVRFETPGNGEGWVGFDKIGGKAGIALGIEKKSDRGKIKAVIGGNHKRAGFEIKFEF
jgi:hypothetical protein